MYGPTSIWWPPWQISSVSSNMGHSWYGWHVAKVRVGNLHVNSKLNPNDVGWNLELAWRIPNPTQVLLTSQSCVTDYLHQINTSCLRPLSMPFMSGLSCGISPCNMKLATMVVQIGSWLAAELNIIITACNIDQAETTQFVLDFSNDPKMDFSQPMQMWSNVITKLSTIIRYSFNHRQYCL